MRPKLAALKPEPGSVKRATSALGLSSWRRALEYVRVHERQKLVHEIIYVDAVVSIDETYGACRTLATAEAARAKAMEVKTALATGICISVPPSD